MNLLKLSAATAAMVVLAACGSSEQPQNLTGVGATFPNPIYSKWFSEYNKLHPMVSINYQSLGSGAGIKQVTDGTVDFGASDGPMNDEQLGAYQAKHSSKLLHFPTVLGSVVPSYNLPGISADLNFTAEALAGIFLGKITKWNDPALVAANQGVKLPAKDIIVVHRSDGSGTTYVWTDYLSKVSTDWAAGPGKGTAINWPVGLGGKGNEGVAGLVKQTDNSIGYVEMIYAVQNKMAMGAVKNSSGQFLKASLASVTAAAEGVEMPADFRVSITNSPSAAAYPIASFTWLLIPEQIQDAGKRTVITEFLKWMLTDGQKMTSALEYAPLPTAVVAKEQAAIALIH